MEYIAMFLVGIGAATLLWFSVRGTTDRYSSWRTIEKWDREKDKSSDNAPTSIREWSDK